MKRTKQRLWLCGALTVFLLSFIWGNSLLPGESSGEVSGFVGALLQTLLPFLDLSSETGMHLLRKAAHFTEFAALGISFTWLWGMLLCKVFPRLALPFLCGTLAAAIDETIQLFSPDRGPSIKDVALDSSGVFTGVLLLTVLHIFYQKRIKNRTH